MMKSAKFLVLSWFYFCFVNFICFAQVSEPKVPSVTVELGIVCDMDFSQNFDFDEEKITDFWISQIWDLQMNFRTLQTINIKFTLTKVMVIKFFIEAVRDTNATVPGHDVLSYFSIWVKMLPIASKSDLVILVTGADWLESHAHLGHICRRGFLAYESVLLIRSLPNDWLSSTYLAFSVATLLGGPPDSGSVCEGRGYIADATVMLQRHWFFSRCSDFYINQHITTNNPLCLRYLASSVDLMRNLTINRRPLSVDEQCKLFFNDSSLQTVDISDVGNCKVIFCGLNTTQSGRNPIVSGVSFPIYNTPCEHEDSFCFRGRCLPRGLIIRSVKKNICITSTNTFAGDDYAQVTDCPDVAEKHHEFMINDKGDDGLVFSMVYTNLNENDKYLTVNSNENKLKFDAHSTTNVSRFHWDLVDAEVGNEYFYLCHRSSKKCAILDDNEESLILVNTSLLSDSNSHMWKFYSNDATSSKSTKYIRKGTQLFSFCQLYFNEPERRACCNETGSFRKCATLKIIVHISNHSVGETGTFKPSNSFENQKSFAEEQKNDFLWLIYLTLGLVLMLIIILIGVAIFSKFFRKSKVANNNDRISLKQFYKGDTNKINANEGVAGQADLLPFDKHWEFPESRLKLGKKLGSGAFGMVVEAKAIGILENEPETTVAVKMVHTSADVTHLKALMTELKIMSHLGGHLNIVNLLGACTKNITKSKQLYVIIEFCKNGCLRDYLQKRRNHFVNDDKEGLYVNTPMPVRKKLIKAEKVVDIIRIVKDGKLDPNSEVHHESPIESQMRPQTARKNVYHVAPVETKEYTGNDNEPKTISGTDLLCCSFQIARGMEYLTSKRILHGDLALRNCLLAENNVVKICDFGFAKTLNKNYDYNYKKDCEGVLLPFKWMAVESMTSGMFSSETDCWSYGIVLWEIFTLGETPYPGFNVDCNFIEYVSNGNRMAKPRRASHRIYDLMLQCWSQNPEARPKFPEIVCTIGGMLENGILQHYVQMNLDYQNVSKFATKSDLLLNIGQSETNPITGENDYQNLASCSLEMSQHGEARKKISLVHS